MIALTALQTTTSKLVAFAPDMLFPEKGGEIVRTFNGVDPKIEFDQVIASWNVQSADTAALTVEVRAHGPGFDTKWYTMGQWSLEGQTAPRSSVNGQKDDNGNVETDTLALKRPGQTLDLRVTLHTVADGPPAVLKFLSLSFADKPAPDSPETSDPAWGKVITVPERAQGNYPGGAEKWCSPTSLSMVLWHWSNELNRPEINKDVPEVQQHVFDSVYDGAGNWPFNTAYAGSFAGMRAYVTRMTGIEDAERWIAKGLPVICSVAYSITQGKPLSPTEAGHLMVLVGFTADGDPVFNDPAHKAQVRKTFKRADFEKGWAYSRNTVYLVYPIGTAVPEDPNGVWADN
jgi:hypothetical protein